MNYKALLMILICLFFSSCTSLGHLIAIGNIKEEKYVQSGQYQKCLDYLLSPEGIFYSPNKIEQIVSESIIRIKNDENTLTSGLTRYLFDLRYLTRSLIEVGRFDEAKKHIEKGTSICQRLLNAVYNSPQKKHTSTSELIIRTDIHLLMYKGYIAWFETGSKAKANKYFEPADNAILNNKLSKRDYSLNVKYNENESIVENIGTTAATIAVKPLDLIFDSFSNFISNPDKLSRTGLQLDRASFYHKIYGDYEKSLLFLNMAFKNGQDFSFLHLPLKYYIYMTVFQKMILINMQMGNLEEANIILEKYNSYTGKIIFELGASTFVLSDVFSGAIASFYATGGALAALSRDFKKSESYFDKAYDIIESIDENTEDENNRYGLSTYYVYKGAYYYGLQNKYDEAAKHIDKGLSFISYYYMLSIQNDLDIESALIHSCEMHMKIANNFKHKKDSANARLHYKIAMDRAESAENQAKKYHNDIGIGRALSLMGWIQYYKGNYKSARNYFNKATKKVKKISNTDNWDIYYGAGKAYETFSPKIAIRHYKNSVDEIEKLWAGRFKETKRQLSFIDDRLAVFEPLIRLLVKKGHYSSAVKYMEQAKSRTLYESLLNNSSDNFQEEKSEWRNIKTLDTSKIKKMLPRKTALLEYYVGKESVIGILITRKGIYPKILKIKAKDLQSYVNDFRHAIAKQEKGYASEDELDECFDKLCNTGNILYKSLIKPFGKKLSQYKHICIIPHGILHYLPFQALTKNVDCLDKTEFKKIVVTDNATKGPKDETVSTKDKLYGTKKEHKKSRTKVKKSKFLVEDYQISYAPSATILNYVRKNNKNQKNSLLAIGSPPEIELNGIIWPKLEYSEEEIKNVARLFTNKTAFIDKKATETAVKEGIENNDILLFSTHGNLNSENPLESYLVFNDDWSNNGSFTVKEIEELKTKANLAVLSACESGLGRGLTTNINEFPNGDDLFGLQRGFMKSGTSSILSTLWRADDRSSESLVYDFFENYIEGGKNKVESLQKAQKDVINMKALWSHPFYWSHFVLSGDWN